AGQRPSLQQAVDLARRDRARADPATTVCASRHRNTRNRTAGADLDDGCRIDDSLISAVDDQHPATRCWLLPDHDVGAGLRSGTNVESHALTFAIDDALGGSRDCLRHYLTVMVRANGEKCVT